MRTGKIICLSGPPGVGKTSIGKSIARSLNRKFFRFSVGGLADVAEIKGHRRTYIGAMPGKNGPMLKNVGTANPLVLIDEIDKVLFVCTANVIEMIPNPLLDRMEVIAIAGYITDEKKHIARDYLEKSTQSVEVVGDSQNYEENSDGDVTTQQATDAAETSSIENPEEPDEQSEVGKAIEGTNKEKEPTSDTTMDKVVIDVSNLVDYVGKPVFHAEKIYDQTPIGVVMGLAWTALGGSTLYVETILVEQGEGKGPFTLTGQLEMS
ncbi:hypothetical protein HPP92_027564 [Vanilla planifolia]|uniref:AAA+ ATPase domain-containing protein n=1 Tax=Vanilla planifolia TaxID=51239 RepID=A0A835UQU5_VANPL|nr:hypothetical protein HPP92_027564 [Vanilla planifolia]KAG0470543.1 hypothetical protein HPP92_017243 [Vanilla planifolia]